VNEGTKEGKKVRSGGLASRWWVGGGRALVTEDENGRKRTYDIKKRKRSIRNISTFNN
jgi:hypothetical protein